MSISYSCIGSWSETVAWLTFKVHKKNFCYQLSVVKALSRSSLTQLGLFLLFSQLLLPPVKSSSTSLQSSTAKRKPFISACEWGYSPFFSVVYNRLLKSPKMHHGIVSWAEIFLNKSEKPCLQHLSIRFNKGFACWLCILVVTEFRHVLVSKLPLSSRSLALRI